MKQVTLPRKWASKKTTSAQESEIEDIQARMAKETGKPVPWLLAKNEYFENQTGPQAEIAPKVEYKVSKIKVLKETKEPMTIDKTKIGVTMVLSKTDCETLGFAPDTTTKQVIKVVRAMLKLEAK